MNALIIYDSLFGNTEKASRALASGLKTGSAGKRIEQTMKRRRMRVVKPHVSAIVRGREGPLAVGVEAQFEQIGGELAQLLSFTQ